MLTFPKKKVETDKILVKGFLSAGVQLSVLRNKHFCEALTKISEFGSKYTPPSNETARTKIALSVKNDVDEEIKIRLSGLSRTGGTICTDGWKDIGSEHLLNGVFVSTDGPIYLRTTNVTGMVKDRYLMAQEITELIEIVGSENVYHVVTDNAAVMKAAKVHVSQDPNYRHIIFSSCAAHALDLFIEDISKEVWTREIFILAKNLVTFIRGHEMCNSTYKNFSKGVNLIKFCETRFAANLIMGERLLNTKEAVQSTFLESSYVKYAEKSTWLELHSLNQEVALSLDFWRNFKKIVELLMPVLVLLRLFDSDIPCAGKVYFKMFRLGEEIKSFSGITHSHKTKAFELLNSRWKLLHSEIHSAGFCLDPEYWANDYKQETNSDVMEEFQSLAINVLGEDRGLKAIEQWSRYKQREGTFSLSIKVKAAENLPAWRWWLLYGSSVPDLQELAVKVLSQVVSSSSCERINSEADHIKSIKKNRMLTRTLQQHLAVHHNLRLIDRLSSYDFEEEPIVWETVV